MLQVSIRKRYGNNGREVRNERNFTLDLDFAAPGGVTILFGPSGSGKTSCLRAVAGIIRPDEGRIAVGKRIYFDSTAGANLTIQERRVGFVFQDYLLFPHLTAEQNVAYGVRSGGGTHKMSKAEKRERARDLLLLLGIDYAAQQYPRELSGGESQRVALARALASDPEMVLLDEPLSAVDALTRARLLAEIGATQRKTGIPFLYVTHNVAEAVEIGDYVVVLNEGRVVQHGAPLEVRI
ncbi:MAG: ABC transporter ATP-binding protein [Blastocatellia bacterium]|nr:ABC transporter ATP-binding protein [Blastocatellia bacterium]